MSVTTTAAPAPLARLLPPDPIVRRLAAVTVVNTFGNGLFFTLSALYFTRIVGLSVSQVGLGLTIAGALGVFAGVPLGHLADRVGTRRLLVLLVCAEALCTVAFTAIHGFAAFLVVVSLSTVADRGSNAVRAAMFAVVLPTQNRTRTRGYLRAVTNVGMGVGGATAAIALQADTRAAYAALILVDAATFVISAVLLHHLPVSDDAAAARAEAASTPQSSPPAEAAGPPRRRRNPALRDRPYLLVTGLSSVLALQFGLIEVGIPLWIVDHTDAPRAMVAAVLVVNPALVVLFQVRATRGVTTVPLAARAARRGGLLLALSCLVFAAAHGPSAAVASGILVAAVVLQTLSEMVSSAAGWALSYDLADERAHGAYQGVFSSGFALAAMLAPLVATATALHHGTAGWALLAAVFAAAGLALGPATRWAAASRAGVSSGTAVTASGSGGTGPGQVL